MTFEYPNAPRIAAFSKVSKERFVADFSDVFPAEAGRAEEIYESLKLPVRATTGSAGYDFFMPVTVTLAPGETVKRQRYPRGSVRRWRRVLCLCCSREAALALSTVCS